MNDEAVHGVPSSRRLRWGDLVKLDVTAELRATWRTIPNHYIQLTPGKPYASCGAERTSNFVTCGCSFEHRVLHLPKDEGNNATSSGQAVYVGLSLHGHATSLGERYEERLAKRSRIMLAVSPRQTPRVHRTWGQSR